MCNPKPNVYVSACLLGERVRYDGKSKTLPYLTQRLSRHCNLTPLCPEVSIGMGTPRPPIQVVKGNEENLALEVENPRHSFGQPLRAFAQRHVQQSNDACGYILKSRSPSCGSGNTPIFHNQHVIEQGDGLFTEAVRNHPYQPPIINEDQLMDDALRDLFLEKVFILHAAHRCKNLKERLQLLDSLQLTLLSHETEPDAINPETPRSFASSLMMALHMPATTTGRIAVCQRIRETLKLDPTALVEPLKVGMNDYNTLQIILRKLSQQHPTLSRQHYLFPSMDEWCLRYEMQIEEEELQLQE